MTEQKPWYEAAFGRDYLERYAHRSQEEADRTIGTLLAHVPLEKRCVTLDLCCGAGRHVLAMQARGYHVIGLDLSADLLAAGLQSFKVETGCFDKHNSRTNCPLFVRGDMRRLPFADRSFGLVTHFFTAFGYFMSDEENFGVFGEVARVLSSGGYYLFDFLSAPDVLRVFVGDETIEAHNRFPDGSQVFTKKRLVNGRRRIEKRMQFVEEGGVRREIVESVRLFTPSELRVALAEKGFVIEQEWGDYDAGAYDESRSKRWIALCRRKD